MSSQLNHIDEFMVKEEPYYEPVGDEIAIFEAKRPVFMLIA